jgi:hypothetical protein
MNDGRMIASWCAAMGHTLLTLLGVAAMYTVLMNTWNALPESYQQRVYKNTLAAVQRQIQQAENPMPAKVISIEAACVDNTILLDYLTSKVALVASEIGSTDPNIPIGNKCTHDEWHFTMPRGCEAYNDEGYEMVIRDAIPITIRRRWATTENQMLELGTSHVAGYEGDDGSDPEADEEKESL